MSTLEKNAGLAGRAGFTLIEILLVVGIIGLLATVVAISIPKQMEKARVSKAMADINGLSLALDSYYMDEGVYPSSLDALTAGDDPILQKGIPSGPWKNTAYQYAYPGSHKPFKYDLQVTKPDGETIANWNMGVKK